MTFCKIFRKFCHFIFLETVLRENYCDTWFFEFIFLWGISQDWVGVSTWFFCKWVTGKLIFGLAQWNMARSIQNYTSEKYSEHRYGQASNVYWIPINRGTYEVAVICLSPTASFSQLNQCIKSEVFH